MAATRSALRFGLYPGIAGTTTLGFNYTGAGTKTVQLFVARSLLTTLKARLLALHHLVCFTAPAAGLTVTIMAPAGDPFGR